MYQNILKHDRYTIATFISVILPYLCRKSEMPEKKSGRGAPAGVGALVYWTE